MSSFVEEFFSRTHLAMWGVGGGLCTLKKKIKSQRSPYIRWSWIYIERKKILHEDFISKKNMWGKGKIYESFIVGKIRG